MTKNWQSWSMVWDTPPIEGHFDIKIYTQGQKCIYDKELLTHRGDSDNTFSQMSESPGYACRGGGGWEFTLTIHIDKIANKRQVCSFRGCPTTLRGWMTPGGMLLGVPIGALAKQQLHLIRLVDPVNRELTKG